MLLCCSDGAKIINNAAETSSEFKETVTEAKETTANAKKTVLEAEKLVGRLKNITNTFHGVIIFAIGLGIRVVSGVIFRVVPEEFNAQEKDYLKLAAMSFAIFGVAMIVFSGIKSSLC